MNISLRNGWMACLAATVAFWAAQPAGAQTSTNEPVRFQAILVWGTDDEMSPDPEHRKLHPRLEERIKSGPYKWKNYFEVARREAHIRPRESVKLQMSKECVLEVKNLADGRVEVKLFGKKKLVSRHVEPIARTLILGGNAENDTAWLIVLRRIEEAQQSPPRTSE